MPHLVFLKECEDVDESKLRSYLEKWEWDGVNSPIEFLILCNWYKIIFFDLFLLSDYNFYVKKVFIYFFCLMFYKTRSFTNSYLISL